MNGRWDKKKNSQLSYLSIQVSTKISMDLTMNKYDQWGEISCQILSPGGNMFCEFYLVKNHKIANNSATTEANEKISIDLESVEF